MKKHLIKTSKESHMISSRITLTLATIGVVFCFFNLNTQTTANNKKSAKANGHLFLSSEIEIYTQKTNSINQGKSLTPIRNTEEYKFDLKLETLDYQQLNSLIQPLQLSNNTINNSEKIINQVFVLQHPPAGKKTASSYLNLSLSVNTDLTIKQNSEKLHFSNDQGIDISYKHLKVSDTYGIILPTKVILIDKTLTLQIDDTQALYPLTIDSVFQQSDVNAFKSEPSEKLGYSVAVSENKKTDRDSNTNNVSYKLGKASSG